MLPGGTGRQGQSGQLVFLYLVLKELLPVGRAKQFVLLGYYHALHRGRGLDEPVDVNGFADVRPAYDFYLVPLLLGKDEHAVIYFKCLRLTDLGILDLLHDRGVDDPPVYSRHYGYFGAYKVDLRRFRTRPALKIPVRGP